ncbi:MAG: beta-ketoacyl-ACP synthase II [Candidatus Omnitrophota bacterium]|jgi:3-oxoacyl-[acyl-carrier-protein] synthase II
MKTPILLIEDDELVLKTIQRLLAAKGYQVDIARNAIEALSRVAVADFDLVISDIRMPGENGIVAVEKIKHVFAERRVVCGFIFISGYAEEDTPAHAIRLGVDKFIHKPFDNEHFLKAIEDELLVVKEEQALKIPPTLTPQISVKKAKMEGVGRKRVVITGIGAVAPNGIGKDAYWDGLTKGKNAVDFITFFDASNFPAKVAAEIPNFDPKLFINDPHEIKRMGRSAHLAVAGGKLALEDAGIMMPIKSDQSVDVMVGSATSGIDYAEPEIRALERGGVRKVRPFAGIAAFGGAISGEVSRAVGANGLSLTFSNGCTSGTDAIGYALKQIRYGLSEVVIAGGADACVTSAIVAAFCQMGAISTRNDKTASRPFNKDRDGFVIAEGSWMFVLEELEHALKRNAKIYGELMGYGATCDAWHMSKPHPSGEYTAQAIQLALADGGIQPEEVDVFEAYGNATPVNDSYETAVVKKVFGPHARKMVVPSVKSMLGHPIGAAGGQQLAAALLALNKGFIHPTINYEIPDPECDLDCVPNTGRHGNFKVAICNSLAFGGKNAAIVIRRFE